MKQRLKERRKRPEYSTDPKLIAKHFTANGFRPIAAVALHRTLDPNRFNEVPIFKGGYDANKKRTRHNKR